MMLRNGWPKFLLREAMQDKLQKTVVWGRGKPHIGGQYNQKCIEREISRGALELETLEAALEGYVDVDALRMDWRVFREGGNADPVHSAYVLSTWLRQSVTRPVVKDQRFS